MFPTQPIAMVIAGLSGLVGLGVSTAALVVAVRDWHQTRCHLGRGLAMAAGFGFLQLPWVVAVCLRGDLGAVVAVPVQPLWNTVFKVANVAIFALATVFLAFELPVAIQVARGRPSFPLLLRQPKGARAILWGMVVGMVAACGSRGLFLLLPSQSPSPPWMWLTTSMDMGNRGWMIGIALCASLAASIHEEILYRGLLQPVAIRLAGRGWLAVVMGIGLTSLVWAGAHAMNSQGWTIKVGQMAVLGIAFGWLGRARGVEASLAAHLTHNAAVIAAYALT